MVQIGPNLSEEIWNIVKEAHGVDLSDPVASEHLRKDLIRLFRESLVIHTNNLFEKNKSVKRLMIRERSKDKIVVLTNG